MSYCTCNQGRSVCHCHARRVTLVDDIDEPALFTLGDIGIAALIVSLFVVIVVLGPMVQDFLRGVWL